MADVRPQSMASPLWHRVEKLRPRLRPHIRIDRQVVRGEVWYVALDPLSNRSHRFTPTVYSMLVRMDGTATLDELWHEAVRTAAEDAPSQDEVIGLLGQLYELELIQAGDGTAVDAEDLSERRQKTEHRRRWQGLRNPIYLRFPLFDPDRLLSRTLHLVAPLFSWLGLFAWGAASTMATSLFTRMGLRATRWSFSGFALKPCNRRERMFFSTAILGVRSLGLPRAFTCVGRWMW